MKVLQKINLFGTAKTMNRLSGMASLNTSGWRLTIEWPAVLLPNGERYD
ncbi:MAG: hypothetical protein WBN22_05675 [Verrucomicrobiia bacterium]